MPTIEDKYCKCPRCRSYPGCARERDLLVFCLRTKAPCQATMQGCTCSSCRVYDMYSLKHEYHCTQGPERKAF